MKIKEGTAQVQSKDGTIHKMPFIEISKIKGSDPKECRKVGKALRDWLEKAEDRKETKA